MADPSADLARYVAERIDGIVTRELTKLKSPAVRANVAHELVERLAAVESTVRAIRGDAIRTMRSSDVAWSAIGELLDVTPQRAQQLAQPQLSEVLPK